MLVELDVFSGQPNPRWRLDQRQHRQFQKLWSRLSAAPAAPDPPPLGYRGFVCRDASGTRRVYRGHVSTSAGALDDPSLSLETFLLDHMPPEFASMRGRIAAQLGSSGPQ